MMPWKLVADPSGYIFTWLIGYSALLGPIGGIMIADYFVCRHRQLNVAALYSPDGEYRYSGGFSWVAIVALLAGALPSLPGFLATVKLIDGAHVATLFPRPLQLRLVRRLRPRLRGLSRPPQTRAQILTNHFTGGNAETDKIHFPRSLRLSVPIREIRG